MVESLEPLQPKHLASAQLADHQPAGNQPAGNQPTGNRPTGNQPAGEQPNEATCTLHDQLVTALLTEQRGQEAEDALQETLERAWQYRHNCDFAKAPKAWLRQATFRCWLDFMKRSRRQPVPIGDHDVAVPTRPDDAPQLRDELQHAMQHMTELERTVLLRFHQHSDTLLDLDKDLNMNVNTVKSHLHGARRRLPRADWS